MAWLLATAPVEPYDDLMRAIVAAQASDSWAVDISAKPVDQPAADGTYSAVKEIQWEVVVGALTYVGSIYVPVVDSLRGQVISLFHDIPESGPLEALTTTELVSRDFYWPAMHSHVVKYVSGCEVCLRINAPWHARPGINMSLETPSRPWEGFTMDFITDLP